MASSTNRPNLIFFLSDDQGWTDVDWRDSAIPTPHLDGLRRGGVEFMAHYTAPVCSPTRASLLTGRAWSRFGILVPNSRQCLPAGTPTLASELKAAGYRTGLTGKWHLGGVDLADKRPSAFGFDYTYGCLDGYAHPYTHEYSPGGQPARGAKKTWHRQGELIEEDGHVTDLIQREAVAFIEASREQPFFLYVPFTAPHVTCVEPPEWLARVPGVSPDRQSYAAMVTHMDAAIGRIIDAVDRAGIRERTLLVFASDNGGALDGGGRNEPFRAGKATMYEGGVRTVALANWPGRFVPGIVDAPVSVMDWMPTFCALAGHTPRTDLKWDGQDISPALLGRGKAQSDRCIYGLSKKAAMVRQGDWKLIVHKPQRAGEDISGQMELYNLAQDPGESADCAATQAPILRKLSKAMAEQMKRDNDSVCRHIGGPLS